VIAWWGWVLIWFGLGLALISVITYCGWILFKKFMTLQRDLFAVADTVAVLDGVEAAAVHRPPNAILEEPAIVTAAYRERARRRRARKATRRLARMERAKLISSVDATSVDITSRKIPHEHG
jgi:hypothetical protein